MLTNLFSGTTVDVLEQVVSFSQARHGVLAGNIANMDTPGYKTRDLSQDQFQTNLKKAIEARNQPQSPGHSDAGQHAAIGGEIRGLNDVRESLKSILYHDGTDVSLEEQIAEISKNHGQHNLAINLMAAQFRLLQTAISERVA